MADMTEIVIPMPPDGWAASLTESAKYELTIDSAGHVHWEQGVDRIVFDGTESWTLVDVRTGEATFSLDTPPTYKRLASDCDAALCTHFKNLGTTNSAASVYTLGVGFALYVNNSNTTRALYINAPFTTVSDLTDWLAENNVTLYYPLATPVTEDCSYVDLPDIPAGATVSIPELESFGCKCWLDADGSIHALMDAWHERNESEVAAETTAALGNVAPVEGDTASTNYAQGDYLVHGGTLCKVTSAIATGEAIALGTNVTATTVMAEILALQE